jgi:hypothetical protein
MKPPIQPQPTPTPVADLFVIAFGVPRPLHFHWIRYCRGIAATFHLITDHPAEWSRLAGGAGNFTTIETSIAQYFNRVADLLGLAGFEEFDRIHGPRLGRFYNGWTACHFKPLLGAMFESRMSHDLFGWMDWDVFPNNALLRRLQDWQHEAPDPSLFTPRGIGWEQFKLLPRESIAAVSGEFRGQLAGRHHAKESTCDAPFVSSPHRAPRGPLLPDRSGRHRRALAILGRHRSRIRPKQDRRARGPVRCQHQQP